MTEYKTMRVRPDFNKLFGKLLCLSHKDICEDLDGNPATLQAGMVLIVFDEDVVEHGNDLIAGHLGGSDAMVRLGSARNRARFRSLLHRSCSGCVAGSRTGFCRNSRTSYRL